MKHSDAKLRRQLWIQLQRSGVSHSTIARIFHVTKQAVSVDLSKVGISTPNKPPLEPTARQIVEAFELRLANHTWAMIGIKFNHSTSWSLRRVKPHVERLARAAGIELPQNLRHQTLQHPPRDFVQQTLKESL